jgi:hypothetical protein
MYYVGNALGSLDNSSQLAANTYGLIVFNGTDRIDYDGLIDRISINFCTAPSSCEARIRVYIIKKNTDNPNQFSIQDDSTYINDLQASEGVQTFKVQIPVEKGDYLGFYFDNDAGNPFTLERDSYYAKLDSSESARLSPMDISRNQSLPEELTFIHCASQGISVRFRIKDDRGICEKIREKFRRWSNVHPGVGESNVLPMQTPQHPHSFYYSKNNSPFFSFLICIV